MDGLLRRALAALTFALASIGAHAETGGGPLEVVLSSGVEGGGYWSAGERLKEAAAGLNLSVENLTSAGSGENMERLLDPASAVSLVFTQTDAALHAINTHPGAATQLELLENLGQECVFVLSAADSGIEDLGDLEDAAKDLKLGIKSAASGIAVTFEYLASQIADLRDIDVVYGDTENAVQGFVDGSSKLDAVMVVHRPKEHSPEVDLAIANPEKITLVEMDTGRLGETLPNGDPVYEQMRLALPGAKEPLQTLCVKGVLLANKLKLGERERNKLTDLVSFHWMKVFATP